MEIIDMVFNVFLTSLTRSLDQFSPIFQTGGISAGEIVGITTKAHSQLKHDPILRLGLWLVLGDGRVPRNITFISASLGDP